MVKLLIIVLGLVIGVSLAGYFYGTLNKDSVSTPPVTSPSPSVATQSSVLATYQTCSNPSKKFTIKYPPDWFTNKVGDLCRFFGIVSSIDEKTALLTLNSSYTPKDFADLKTNLGRSNEERIILSTRTIEVGSLLVPRVETEGTGSGESTKGSRSVYYLIENPTTPIVFSYEEKTTQPDREKYLKVMEVMVSSLTFN